MSKWRLGYNGLGTDLSKIEFGVGYAAIGYWGDYICLNFFFDAVIDVLQRLYPGRRWMPSLIASWS